MKVRIATRRSALALAQTRQMAARIRGLRAGIETEEVQIVTEGDRVQDRALAAMGGKGLFIKELEAALLDGRADLAVHSMKDLPAEIADGLAVVCVPERESPWDLLVSRDGVGLSALAPRARVGTSSLRRRYQLLARRPDLEIELLRGNIDTRLRKLDEGGFDAIVLAEAGVRRLGLEVAGVRLDGGFVPAVAQGALALEARSDDAAIALLLAPLMHEETYAAASVERGVLRALGADCAMPVGAHAIGDASGWRVRGFLADGDGARHVYADVRGARVEGEALGRHLAGELRARLARESRA